MAGADPGLLRYLSRSRKKLLLSLVLGAAIALWMARGGLPLAWSEGAFQGAKLWVLPGYAAVLVAYHLLRAARWRHLLRPLGEVSPRDLYAVSFLSFAAILLAPMRTGEVVRPYLLARRTRISVWEATGTVGAERVVDGLALSVALVLGLALAEPLDPLPRRIGDFEVPTAAVPAAAWMSLLAFAAAYALLIVFFLRRAAARRLLSASVGLVSRPLARWLSDAVEKVAEGLRFLPSPRDAGGFLLETALYWLLNAASMWLLAWAVGLPGITLAQICVVMGCLGMGMLLPAGPGYFGIFQLSVYMALAMYFPEPVVLGAGSAYVFLLYVSHLALNLLGAALGAVWLSPARTRGGEAPAHSRAAEGPGAAALASKSTH